METGGSWSCWPANLDNSESSRFSEVPESKPIRTVIEKDNWCWPLVPKCIHAHTALGASDKDLSVTWGWHLWFPPSHALLLHCTDGLPSKYTSLSPLCSWQFGTQWLPKIMWGLGRVQKWMLNLPANSDNGPPGAWIMEPSKIWPKQNLERKSRRTHKSLHQRDEWWYPLRLGVHTARSQELCIPEQHSFQEGPWYCGNMLYF